MKNLLKIGAVAVVTALSVVACDPPKSDTNTGVDTLKVDSNKKDTVKVDTTKQDTAVQATTAVKKGTVKK